MCKKLGFVVLLFSVSLVFTNVTADALAAGSADKIQKTPKLEGKWKIFEKPRLLKGRGARKEPDFTQIGEIEFKKGRDGKFFGTITSMVGGRLPKGGTVNGIRYEESSLGFQILYSENDRRVFMLKVDGTNKFLGQWMWSGQGPLGEIRLEK